VAAEANDDWKSIISFVACFIFDRVNNSGSSQWITLANGLRQFVSDNEEVEISQDAFNSFRPGGREVDSTAVPSVSSPKPGMDIWWAIKMGLSSKVELFISESDDKEAFMQQHDVVSDARVYDYG